MSVIKTKSNSKKKTIRFDNLSNLSFSRGNLYDIPSPIKHGIIVINKFPILKNLNIVENK